MNTTAQNPQDLFRKLGVHNVKDYGAKGDGSSDDGPCIQNAIDAAIGAGGGTIFVPNGTYLVNELTIPPDTIGVYLVVKAGTERSSAGTAAGPAF